MGGIGTGFGLKDLGRPKVSGSVGVRKGWGPRVGLRFTGWFEG